jgi:hypothetical protein
MNYQELFDGAEDTDERANMLNLILVERGVRPGCVLYHNPQHNKIQTLMQTSDVYLFNDSSDVLVTKPRGEWEVVSLKQLYDTSPHDTDLEKYVGEAIGYRYAGKQGWHDTAIPRLALSVNLCTRTESGQLYCELCPDLRHLSKIHAVGKELQAQFTRVLDDLKLRGYAIRYNVSVLYPDGSVKNMGPWQ